MSFNSFGKILTCTTWGESHGIAIGGVMEGVPAGLSLSEEDIQPYLDKRRPGYSFFTSPRKEADKIHLLSGVFEGKTTGAPLSFIIYNTAHNSREYKATQFRPGHADYTYFKKYAFRDYRGGGRASARETAIRVAAGAVARKILPRDIIIKGALIQIGKHKIRNFSWQEVNNNPFFCPDKDMVSVWREYLQEIKNQGDSIGAIIEIHAIKVPPGLGEPLYSKLDTKLAEAIMSINAVKGVEIGDGFGTARLLGSQNADQMRFKDNAVHFLSNHCGGIIGGISTGQTIVVRFVVKPTSSIAKPLQSIDCNYNNITISTTGRHDPCVGIRAVPVGEAMVACVLADFVLLHRTRTSLV